MRVIALLMLLLWVTSCATTWVRTVPIAATTPGNSSPNNQLSTDNESGVTIFLLERDIPVDIKRLAIVYIYPINTGSKTDDLVKQELRKQCQQLGANGAYRLNEQYYPDTRRAEVPYLVFRYTK